MYFLCSLQISIEPHEAGTFTSQLQVYSFPVVSEVQPITHSLGPVLSLEVVAEEPRIEVWLWLRARVGMFFVGGF